MSFSLLKIFPVYKNCSETVALLRPHAEIYDVDVSAVHFAELPTITLWGVMITHFDLHYA